MLIGLVFVNRVHPSYLPVVIGYQIALIFHAFAFRLGLAEFIFGRFIILKAHIADKPLVDLETTLPYHSKNINKFRIKAYKFLIGNGRIGVMLMDCSQL